MAEPKRPKQYKGAKCLGVTRAKGNKKDTKRWCRGVPGREHRKEWVLDQRYQCFPYRDMRWFSYRCTVCEKEFDYCYASGRIFSKVCKCGNHSPEEMKGRIK